MVATWPDADKNLVAAAKVMAGNLAEDPVAGTLAPPIIHKTPRGNITDAVINMSGAVPLWMHYLIYIRDFMGAFKFAEERAKADLKSE